MLSRHDLDISADNIREVQAGNPVERWTDQRLLVLLVREDLFDQTPAPAGAHLIPLSTGFTNELVAHGHTGWAPKHSKYLFSIRYTH